MGLLSRLLGNASEADVGDVEEYLGKILADGETVQRAFALVRDLFIFTDRRFIMVDKQGMTGMKELVANAKADVIDAAVGIEVEVAQGACDHALPDAVRRAGWHCGLLLAPGVDRVRRGYADAATGLAGGCGRRTGSPAPWAASPPMMMSERI